jgi:hypothetical protein
MNDLMTKTVILDNFQDFPSLACTVTGNLSFNHYSKHKTVRDVNETRMEYFAQRLMQAEERVFSHADVYCRAKMGATEKRIKVVNHVHAVLGSAARKWVLGIVTQKEDSNYYLEDSTFTVKISFAELEYVE